jgi:hypothetical protein
MFRKILNFGVVLLPTIYEYNVMTFFVFPILTYQNIGRNIVWNNKNINVGAFSAIKQVITDFRSISVIIHLG